MKILLSLVLLTLSLSVLAESKRIEICDQNYNCEIVTITNYNQPKSNDALLRLIAESGSKNFETINRGWNPQQYRNQYRNY